MNSPRPVVIEGYGARVWRSYGEVIAAVDRAYAAPRDQPLPIEQVFAELAVEPELGAGKEMILAQSRNPLDPSPFPG